MISELPGAQGSSCPSEGCGQRLKGVTRRFLNWTGARSLVNNGQHVWPGEESDMVKQTDLISGLRALSYAAGQEVRQVSRLDHGT